MSTYCLLATIVLTFLYIQNSTAKDCSESCSKCPPTPACAPGVSLVSDECGCCKTCARQLNKPCDAANPCDHHKGLYCSFGDVDDTTGICVAKPGRSCYLNGNVYLNGESFAPTCKMLCTCIDSDVGCTPQCPNKLQIPRNCAHPRLVLKPGKCCEEWTCISSDLKSELPRIRQQARSHRRSHSLHRSPYMFAAARRRSEIALAVRASDKCIIQTTQWSSCTKTCGWGVSERLTNDNKACKLKKESRLCQVRPCDTDFTASIKKGKKCIKSPRAQKPVRYSFSGCKTKVYTPKYCGQCVDGKCCSPDRTKTVSVTFHCENGVSFKKKMMQVKSCSCNLKCSQSKNDIFTPHRGVDVQDDTNAA